MRINKLLSNYGVCSRKEANKIIEEGRVVVNGALCEKGQWVEESDHILLDGEILKKKESVYIALNKPRGIVCTSSNEVKDNVIDFVGFKEYIFPIGRLDKESEGLLLLTNDGDFANEILSSENKKEKEYIVRVNRNFDDEFLKGMANGVDIGDIVTRKCLVERITDDTFKIVLTQGVNRQIRRMSLAFGYRVMELKRIRILNLELGDLESGEWRFLSKEEALNMIS